MREISYHFLWIKFLFFMWFQFISISICNLSYIMYHYCPLNWLVITDQRTHTLRILFCLFRGNKRSFWDFDFSFIRFYKRNAFSLALRVCGKTWYKNGYTTEYKTNERKWVCIQFESFSQLQVLLCSNRNSLRHKCEGWLFLTAFSNLFCKTVFQWQAFLVISFWSPLNFVSFNCHPRIVTFDSSIDWHRFHSCIPTRILSFIEFDDNLK